MRITPSRHSEISPSLPIRHPLHSCISNSHAIMAIKGQSLLATKGRLLPQSRPAPMPAQFLPLFFVKRAPNLLYAPAALCFSCASAAAFQIRAESREPHAIDVSQCPGAAERSRHHHEDSLAKPHTCCLLSPCALPRSKPVSPQDPNAELRSANSFTAPDTPNWTRSLKFRAPVCRHHHPLQNPFASFIFFHPLVSTP
jgi:hypothetical protein